MTQERRTSKRNGSLMNRSPSFEQKFRENYQTIALASTDYTTKLDLLQNTQNVLFSPSLFPSDQSRTDFCFSMIVCLSCPSITVRTAALRTTRFFLTKEIVSELLAQNAHYFIVTSLERYKDSRPERIQAIKLIETFFGIDAAGFPRAFTQAIISIAKQADDPYRDYAVNLLCQLAYENTAIVRECKGIQVLFQVVMELPPPKAIFQDSIVTVLCYLLTKPARREYVDSGFISQIFVPFTNTYESSEDINQSNWAIAKNAIISMLRSWSGLISVVNDPSGLQFLVQCLQLPNFTLLKHLLSLFSRIFRLGIPSVLKDPFQLKIHTDSTEYTSTRYDLVHKPNLLDCYLAALLVAFNEAKLLENLIKLCNRMSSATFEEASQCSQITKQATCLIGDLLHLSNHLLPTSFCARLQSLPLLVNNAIAFNKDPKIRNLSSTTVANLEKYSMLKQTDTRGSQLDYFGEVKKKIDLTMDEPLLREKQVLLKKEFHNWRWDIIQELIDGPLYHPPYFDSPLVQKLIKQLLTFLLPTSKTFSTIPYNQDNLHKYVHTSIQLLKLMLFFPSGQQILSSHKLISQIRTILLAEIESPKENSPLSRDNLLRTMNVAYFHLLGALSGIKAGRDLLVKHHLFDILIPLANVDGRDDLSLVIIKNLDYQAPDSSSRILLSSLFKSKSLVVRFLAMKQMSTLFQTGTADFHQWCIVHLKKQLEDPDKKITGTALRILVEVTEDPECAAAFIFRKPYPELSRLEAGPDLLLKFLSLPTGFKYLSTTPFIDEQLKSWEDTRFLTYVTTLEYKLYSAFASPVWKLKEGQSDTIVQVPKHFYGQLGATEEGIRLLKDKGIFEKLITLVTTECSDIEKRAAMWAFGTIGATRLGFKMLIQTHNVLQMIISLCSSPCLATRGTAYFVLGMFARSNSGIKALEKLGWECTPGGKGIAVPLTISTLFHIPTWTPVATQTTSYTPAQYPNDSIRQEIITKFVMLCNSIKSEKALNALKRLKEAHPDQFDTELQFEVFHLLEFFSFKWAARRICCQIFNCHWKPEDIKKLPRNERVVLPLKKETSHPAEPMNERKKKNKSKKVRPTPSQ